MTRIQLEDAIFDVIDPAVSIPVVWANKNTESGASGRVPDKAYVELNVVSGEIDGLPDGDRDTVLVGAEHLARMTEDIYYRISVKTKSRDESTSAWDTAQSLRRYLQTPSARRLLKQSNLGFMSTSSPTNLSNVYGAGWSSVQTFDLFLHSRVSSDSNEGYIEIIQIDVDYLRGETVLESSQIDVGD